ncbi:hypothetical protein V496_04017 [Pseudogymnoascus sp. VKM F-4515 (FW-2607)]|nr:hypothetical protein V496_04017 [Pseudogymnoascus sp. VKM F-4515 (FW-2607)]KFY83635.1 hypothetical protein V498_07919 [Pseudogymnoascus sp. VKM F-4517 (FW-2822)]
MKVHAPSPSALLYRFLFIPETTLKFQVIDPVPPYEVTIVANQTPASAKKNKKKDSTSPRAPYTPNFPSRPSPPPSTSPPIPRA